MGTVEFRFVLALVLLWMCPRLAEGAESEKHFEGPYKITITSSQRYRATVKTAYRFPNMISQEWWVAYPLPPEFPVRPRPEEKSVSKIYRQPSPVGTPTKARCGSRL